MFGINIMDVRIMIGPKDRQGPTFRVTYSAFLEWLLFGGQVLARAFLTPQRFTLNLSVGLSPSGAMVMNYVCMIITHSTTSAVTGGLLVISLGQVERVCRRRFLTFRVLVGGLLGALGTVRLRHHLNVPLTQRL